MDHALKVLANASEDFRIDEIFLQMQETTNEISLDETRMSLNKLIKSGYADSYETRTEHFSNTVAQDPFIIKSVHYRITYDGYSNAY